MEGQRSIFNDNIELKEEDKNFPELDKFRAAVVFSAIGDALGWPTEFLREEPKRKPPFDFPLNKFVHWKKHVGGRWWGYLDEIKPGEYSDDTQLNLAVARCISSNGNFEPKRFAYTELPLWLHYERGGGKSIKTAARTLIRRKTDWIHNFYRQGLLDYRRAGANGAAMRNLPIALVSIADEKRLVKDSFYNAIITHGHPRAILGTILFGLAIRYAIKETSFKANLLVEYLCEVIGNIGRLVADETNIKEWIRNWEDCERGEMDSFKEIFTETRVEANRYLSAIKEFIKRPVKEYYRSIGALNPQTKGSGLATVCAAIFLFLRDDYNPEKKIYEAVNMIGSDTDTIASFLGALLGARYGLTVIPKHLWEKVQDRDYLIKTGNRLHTIAFRKPTVQVAIDRPLEKEEAYLKILAWEIGLHEMFWDAIDIGGIVVHPTLGKGEITSKKVRKIARQGYKAKLIHIKFDSGQTCVFHSRVQNDIKLSESLAKDIGNSLLQQ